MPFQKLLRPVSQICLQFKSLMSGFSKAPKVSHKKRGHYKVNAWLKCHSSMMPVRCQNKSGSMRCQWVPSSACQGDGRGLHPLEIAHDVLHAEDVA